MRILFIGDIVGKPGRRIIRQTLAQVRQREQLNFVIANAETPPTVRGSRRRSSRNCLTAGWTV